ncbi:inner centromere protein [Vararia minispora EC-137]|uniref:Inner centromere protein n=1 Tax=Vararia minispora EC-137 TaxID=1314806 RepID=A0ACB8QHV9_9AGAM|nr:inner centromere protein [Vararia minispora EC-137]
MESKAGKGPHAGPSKPPPTAQQEPEWIDLPEPDSEYSNSEDEGKTKNYEVADWAQSPSLMAQLSQQQTLDPDDIFGPIRPLRMEDMFRTRQSRFRARTSSANWSGPDGLTEMEAREYARRMGFQ